MRKHLTRLLFILVVAWGGIAYAAANDLAPKLGLDLQGGISVILTAPENTEEGLLQTAADVMLNRIEGLGNVQEPEIAPFGDRNILVQLPGVTNQEQALEVLGQTGQLTFRPVCSAQDSSSALIDGINGPQYDEPCLETLPVLDAGCTGVVPVMLSEGQDLGMTDVGPDGLAIEDDINGTSWLPEFDDEGNEVARYLLGPAELLGTDVTGSTINVDGRGEFIVTLELSTDGDDKFALMTGKAACFTDPNHRRIAIVLDGEVLSSPGVTSEIVPGYFPDNPGRAGISGGSAVITVGGADQTAQQEAEDLSLILRYGSLPVELERSQLSKVSATLGADSLSTGVTAGAVGLVLVAIALLVYYRSLGLVSIVGLTVFGSLLMLAYIVLGEFNGLSLTLAGVTGIIVSVGITADSYIVYFERIKEELRKGRVMDDAITVGFERAFRTILTADTVSFMGAILLYVLAVGPVKGFALALGIATLLDVFVVRLYTRNAVALVASGRLGEGGAFSVRGASGVAK